MTDTKLATGAHNIFIENRTKTEITGVVDVESFDEETVTLSTQMGVLTIRGEDLHVTRFTVETGELCIEGTIIAFVYIGEKVKSGFFSRLFK